MDTTITTLIVVALLAVYYFIKRHYLYWERKGLNYFEPEFFYGNVKQLFKRQMAFGDIFNKFYQDSRRRGWKHVGIFMFFKPVYIPTDPELIKSIMQKDFEYFLNHGGYVDEEADPLSGHLFNLEGTKWRNLRVLLTPTFTSGKMKQMFHTLVECSYELQNILHKQYADKEIVDIKELVARFTTDVIGSCAFGLDCNSMKDPDAEFRKIGKKLFEPTFALRMKRILINIFPARILKKAGLKLMRNEIESFFLKVVGDTMAFREKNNIVRNDFLQLMLQLKNKEDTVSKDVSEENKTETQKTSLSLNEIAAQCFVFFIAGFETSSTTMTFAFFELSLNQDIQEKLRAEIISVLKKHDNKITYDSIMEMEYLEKVVNETLRKYPALPVIPRVCTKDYHVPGTDFVIEKGTPVQIPAMAIQNDPEYYPNPDLFDPDRFSEENKATRPVFSFIPFGEGPRMCIGLRFGKMQTKLGLITVLRNYRVSLNKKTKTPIKLDPKQFLLSVEGGVWLNLHSVK